MSFVKGIALINGDDTESSFTGITGKKAEYDDDESAEEGK